MTDRLKEYLTYYKDKVENEEFEYLQEQCPAECKKELRLLLLECSDNDKSVIVQSILARALQREFDKFMPDAFVVHIVMYQPQKHEGDRYVGEFEYTILVNNKIYDDIYEYDVVAPTLPRATSILTQCGEKFANYLKETIR